MKTCRKCKQEKKLSEFYKKSDALDYLRPDCKQCNRDGRNAWNASQPFGHLRKYTIARTAKKAGVTVEFIYQQLELQGYRCKMCNIHEDELKGRKQTLCIDHCHKTNTFRGMLCSKCNSVLGYALDNIETLQNGINYLKEKGPTTKVIEPS